MRDWGWAEHATPGYIRSHVARVRDRPRRRRPGPGPDLPAADADPHPLGQREVPQRDLQLPPAVAQLPRRRPARRGDRGPGPAQHLHRLPGRAGLGHRGHPARGVRVVPPHGSLAAARHRGQPLGPGPGRHHATRTDRTPGCCATAAGSSRSPPTTRTPQRIWWTDPGVHQNLAFGVQPDPWSGQHCWLQKVRMEPARSGGPLRRRLRRRRPLPQVYREWLAKTRPRLGPGGQRRPEFLMRPVKPRPPRVPGPCPGRTGQWRPDGSGPRSRRGRELRMSRAAREERSPAHAPPRAGSWTRSWAVPSTSSAWWPPSRASAAGSASRSQLPTSEHPAGDELAAAVGAAVEDVLGRARRVRVTSTSMTPYRRAELAQHLRATTPPLSGGLGSRTRIYAVASRQGRRRQVHGHRQPGRRAGRRRRTGRRARRRRLGLLDPPAVRRPRATRSSSAS